MYGVKHKVTQGAIGERTVKLLGDNGADGGQTCHPVVRWPQTKTTTLLLYTFWGMFQEMNDGALDAPEILNKVILYIIW